MFVLYFVLAQTVFSSSLVVFCFQLMLLEVDGDGLEQGLKVVCLAVNIPFLKWVVLTSGQSPLYVSVTVAFHIDDCRDNNLMHSKSTLLSLSS